jgi:TPR repeat protein
MMNLASTLVNGGGEGAFRVNADPEHAVQILERAMQLKIPAAFDLMGTLHQRGLGVKRDSSRAYAFWQLAGEMGSPRAQNAIGRKLIGHEDNPTEDIWANEVIGVRMLECSTAQGYGPGALNLGLVVELFQKDYPRALTIYHSGVMMGSERCAARLSLDFDGGGKTVNGVVDKSRAERYQVLADRLYFQPDLRFPNLDKILPLPPAPLPKWNGNKETLIDAALGVVPLPDGLALPH